MKYPFPPLAELDLTRFAEQAFLAQAVVENTELRELKNVLADVRNPEYGCEAARVGILRHWLAIWWSDTTGSLFAGPVIQGLPDHVLREIAVHLSFEMRSSLRRRLR